MFCSCMQLCQLLQALPKQTHERQTFAAFAGSCIGVGCCIYAYVSGVCSSLCVAVSVIVEAVFRFACKAF